MATQWPVRQASVDTSIRLDSQFLPRWKWAQALRLELFGHVPFGVKEGHAPRRRFACFVLPHASRELGRCPFGSFWPQTIWPKRLLSRSVRQASIDTSIRLEFQFLPAMPPKTRAATGAAAKKRVVPGAAVKKRAAPGAACRQARVDRANERLHKRRAALRSLNSSWHKQLAGNGPLGTCQPAHALASCASTHEIWRRCPVKF